MAVALRGVNAGTASEVGQPRRRGPRQSPSCRRRRDRLAASPRAGCRRSRRIREPEADRRRRRGILPETRASSERIARAPRSSSFRRGLAPPRVLAVSRGRRIWSATAPNGKGSWRRALALNHAPHHASHTSFQRSIGEPSRCSVVSARSLARTCSSVSPGSVAIRDLTAIVSRSMPTKASSPKSGNATGRSRRAPPGAWRAMSRHSDAPTRLLPARSR